jgi:nucleoside diphosphate kinase
VLRDHRCSTGAAEEWRKVYPGVVTEFIGMINGMALGACLVLEIVKGETIVAEFREARRPRDAVVPKQIRPKSIRALFGEDVIRNSGECTDLKKDVQLEVEDFFVLGE